MFSAYSCFAKPELYASIRATTLAWAGAGTRTVFLKMGPDESLLQPQNRPLAAGELATLKGKMDSAWEGDDFGGFICGANLADLKGWCHFSLNPQKTEARLDSLVLDPALAEISPLQNPALHLALLALLKELPELQAIILPFGEISEPDRAALKMFWLAPGGEEGQWLTRQKFERKTDFMAFMVDQSAMAWFEIKLQVEPALSDLVLRLFVRFGYRDKTRLEPSLKKGLLGEEIVEETGPVTIITYLPKNDNNSQRLVDLQEALRNLSLICPVPQLELNVVGRAWALSSDKKSKSIYRIGRNFVIHSINDNEVNNEIELGPNDLLIKLNDSPAVFGPKRGFIHPSGQLALELLEDWLDPAQHFKVLDLGTGSGSLAIAAARRGISYILAIDPDHEAVKLARENVVLNSLEDKISIEAGSLGLKDSDNTGYTFGEELQQRPPSLDKDLPFDFILANIYPPNLITLAGAMSESLRPGGLLISGGIPEKDVAEVNAAYLEVGLKLLEKRSLIGWYAFVHTKF
jgi:ribosomal protein L11 methylase PrmA